MKHERARAVAVAVALAGAVAPASAQRGGGVEFRLGVMGGGGMCGVALLPGVEWHGGGALHPLAILDAQLFRGGSVVRCEPRPAAGGSVEVTRAAVAPPRLRAGLGWRGARADGAVAVRGYVGQQGVAEGFHPLAGAGGTLRRGTLTLGVDGMLVRATRYRVEPDPFVPQLTTQTPVGRTWVPRWELSAGVGAGGLEGDVLRAAALGAAAGAAGLLVGGFAAALLSGCDGEGCGAWFIAGAVAGETLLLPAGVHLGAGRNASLALLTLASVGVTAAGVLSLAVVGDSGAPATGVAILVPIAQLAATIALERRARGR